MKKPNLKHWKKQTLIPLLLCVTACVGWPGADQICPIKPVYTEADVEVISDELAEWVYAVELQGEKLGCWDLPE